MARATPLVTRRFLDLPARRVHYFRAGEGPPAVLVHSSPANARLLAKEIDRLSQDFTVFAFDTPGFGLSEALPLAEMEVADLADALAETLAVIAMPPCPMFGTHTGAAIALEFGVRYPDRVTGLVLDGVPAFTDEECARFFGDYFRKLPFDDLGSQYSATWTRFRDQSVWFPWSEREVANLNPYDLSPPHSTHLWTAMYYEAAESYEPAYRAASFYGAKALTAVAALTVPAVFTATETDMLYPHLDRLPPLKTGQSIVDIGSSYERKRDLIADCFTRYGAEGPAPNDRDAIGSSDTVARQFVDGSQGALHLRFAGRRSAPALLLMHDAPGSSEQLDAIIAALAATFFVIAPDLPGHGESTGFAEQPDIAAFSGEMLSLLDCLDIATATVFGFGFGSSVALDLANSAPARVGRVAVAGVLLPDAAERLRLVEHLTPTIEITADGAHWYRTWLMLRDSKVYWPWFDRTLPALRRVDADFSARPLHRWTLDVMRARESYHHLIQAALQHDAEAALRTVATPLVRIHDRARPLSAYDARVSAVRGDTVSVDAGDLAGLVAALS